MNELLGTCRGLLRDWEIFANLRLTYVSSSRKFPTFFEGFPYLSYFFPGVQLSREKCEVMLVAVVCELWGGCQSGGALPALLQRLAVGHQSRHGPGPRHGSHPGQHSAKLQNWTNHRWVQLLSHQAKFLWVDDVWITGYLAQRLSIQHLARLRLQMLLICFAEMMTVDEVL